MSNQLKVGKARMSLFSSTVILSALAFPGPAHNEREMGNLGGDRARTRNKRTTGQTGNGLPGQGLSPNGTQGEPTGFLPRARLFLLFCLFHKAQPLCGLHSSLACLLPPPESNRLLSRFQVLMSNSDNLCGNVELQLGTLLTRGGNTISRPVNQSVNQQYLQLYCRAGPTVAVLSAIQFL